MVGKKVVSVVLLMALALTAIPLNGFAAPVNKAIASDPAAVDAAIEAMNLPDMPDEVAAEFRGEGWYILAGYALQIASWCTMYCQQAYDMADAYLNLVSSYYRSLPRGTPVYAGTAQSTPAYYKR